MSNDSDGLVCRVRHDVIRPLLHSWARHVNAVDARWTGLHEVRKRFPCPVLPSGRSLRVAFLSDLHAGPTTSGRLFELVGDAVAGWRPHLLLLGGDYVFTAAEHAARLLPLLRRCRGTLGTFGVWGNHDLYEGTAKIAPILAEADVHILRDDSVRLPPPYERVIVAGTDDCGRGTPALDKTLSTRGDDFVLLLTHNPDIVGRALPDERRPALTLAGHTHGGGVCLPGGRPLVHPSKYGFVAGDYDTAWGPLHISRGVGCVELPLRILAPPEALLLTLSANGA